MSNLYLATSGAFLCDKHVSGREDSAVKMTDAQIEKHGRNLGAAPECGCCLDAEEAAALDAVPHGN